MNEHAVEALREAMEAPSWWTNRARLSAREVLGRLEAQGYQVAPIEGSTAARAEEHDLRAAEETAAVEARASHEGAAAEPKTTEEAAAHPRTGLSRFMGELETRVAGARRDTEAAVQDDLQAAAEDEAERRSA